MAYLNEEDIEWMRSEMCEDTAGTLVNINYVENQIEGILHQISLNYDEEEDVPKFEMISDMAEMYLEKCECDGGYLVKTSTLKYIMETLVNRVINRME